MTTVCPSPDSLRALSGSSRWVIFGRRVIWPPSEGPRLYTFVGRAPRTRLLGDRHVCASIACDGTGGSKRPGRCLPSGSAKIHPLTALRIESPGKEVALLGVRTFFTAIQVGAHLRRRIVVDTQLLCHLAITVRRVGLEVRRDRVPLPGRRQVATVHVHRQHEGGRVHIGPATAPCLCPTSGAWSVRCGYGEPTRRSPLYPSARRGGHRSRGA
jgi:hypothetical protein